jgi:acylphosphatase
MPELARLHAVVYGDVQGVNFRAATRRQAQSLGLVGWVKNLPDYSVEVLAEGARPKLQHLLNWLHTGPPAARVHDVRFTWHDAENQFSQFTVQF